MFGKLGQCVKEDGPYKKAAIHRAIDESAASESTTRRRQLELTGRQVASS